MDTCQPDPKSSYMQKYQKHEPMSFSLYIKYKHGDYKPPITYRCPNATKVFYETLKAEALEMKKIYDKKHPIKITDEDDRNFKRTHICHICGFNIKEVPSPYSSKDSGDFQKVIDHDHLLNPSKHESNYRGPAHNLCKCTNTLPSFLSSFTTYLSTILIYS
ncbi:uncharacterized protein TNIN_277751 [Trichonephila inaurata madagascariensis]|uniref:Uncharacterized protein n=1 Tax=Trichonephila inaurata madagascariensis TaxID=2747483 RepID=A0A8X7C7U0_9ARAC|nr:uncharacterized protein TNIN_277751 [Trichonephila inaurata madagascariensis]